MEISARIFGVNSWSILVPQALEGVATVGVLYATVRRWFVPGAALLAGTVLALTPVAALMFRFNNPDALLDPAAHRGGLRHRPGAGGRALAVDGPGRHAHRVRIHHQDAPGSDPHSGAGPGVPVGRTTQVRAPDHPGRLLRNRPAGGGRVVGGRRPADSGCRPPLRRRFDQQQRVEPHLRLQRVRSAHRQRDRQRRRRWFRSGGREHVGADGLGPAVPDRPWAVRSRG